MYNSTCDKEKIPELKKKIFGLRKEDSYERGKYE
jgi:hypothetical protein